MDQDFEVSQVMGPWFEYVDKFARKDFMFWKFKMQTMVKAKNLQGLINGKEVWCKVYGAKSIWERSQNEHDAITLSTYTKRESWFHHTKFDK